MKELFQQLYQDLTYGIGHFLLFQILYSFILVALLVELFSQLQTILDRAIAQSEITTTLVPNTNFLLTFILWLTSIVLIVFLQRYALIHMTASVHQQQPVRYTSILWSVIRKLPWIILIGAFHLAIYAGLFVTSLAGLMVLRKGVTQSEIGTLLILGLALTSFTLLYLKTVFVLHVLALEDTGPIQAFKRSFQLSQHQQWRGSIFYIMFYLTFALLVGFAYALYLALQTTYTAVTANLTLDTIDTIAQDLSNIIISTVVALSIMVAFTTVRNVVGTIRYFKQKEVLDGVK